MSRERPKTFRRRTVRQELADAHQRLRDVERNIEHAKLPLYERIHALEAENKRLRRALREVGRAQHTLRVIAHVIEKSAIANDAVIDQSLATGNRLDGDDGGERAL